MNSVHSLASWEKQCLHFCMWGLVCSCQHEYSHSCIVYHAFVSVYSTQRLSFLRAVYKCKLNALAFTFSPPAKFTPQQIFSRDIWGHLNSLLDSYSQCFLCTLCHCEYTFTKTKIWPHFRTYICPIQFCPLYDIILTESMEKCCGRVMCSCIQKYLLLMLSLQLSPTLLCVHVCKAGAEFILV